MAPLDAVFSSPLFGNGAVSHHIEKTLIDLNSLECKVRLISRLRSWNVIKVSLIEK